MMIWRQNSSKSAGRLFDRWIRGRQRIVPAPGAGPVKPIPATQATRPGPAGSHAPTKGR